MLETTGHPDADALASTFNTMLMRVDATDEAHRGVMRRTVHQLTTGGTADILDDLRTLQDLPVGRRIPPATPASLDHLYTRIRTAVRDEVGARVSFSSKNIEDLNVELSPDLIVIAARHVARSAHMRSGEEIVAMRMELADGELTIDAADNAGVIDAEHLPAFFEWDPDPLAIEALSDQPHLSHAIIRIVADIHGGHAWVESEPELGTRIGVTIPAPLTYPDDEESEEE